MIRFKTVHHVQIAIPPGEEARALDFYLGVLGFAEVERPAILDGRGGAWLEAGEISLHLGVQRDDFAPASQAHPAFEVESLEATKAHLDATGTAYRPDVDLPGFKRVFVFDPFGNRIELLEVV